MMMVDDDCSLSLAVASNLTTKEWDTTKTSNLTSEFCIENLAGFLTSKTLRGQGLTAARFTHEKWLK